jgi:hypothetical protein
LHAGRGEHGHPSPASLARGLGKQTRLPDPRLATQHERLATGCDLVQQRHQERLFVCATKKGRGPVLSRRKHRRQSCHVKLAAIHSSLRLASDMSSILRPTNSTPVSVRWRAFQQRGCIDPRRAACRGAGAF